MHVVEYVYLTAVVEDHVDHAVAVDVGEVNQRRNGGYVWIVEEVVSLNEAELRYFEVILGHQPLRVYFVVIATKSL